ncbi:CS1 type fimbrial major subunit, partial [Shigella sonnei]
ATKIFASDALTNGSLAKNLMFAQTTKGVLETGIYRGVVSIYLSQDI